VLINDTRVQYSMSDDTRVCLKNGLPLLIVPSMANE
jgi:hypothetical protein